MKWIALVIAAATWASPDACLAWDATGHEWVSGIAIEKLPDTLPEFVRTPEAAAEIAVMDHELDRSKGSGTTRDARRDPGHYVNLTDDGAVVGVVPLSLIPDTREEYDTLLRAEGVTQYEAGYLPYSLVDGWRQIRQDFAHWRADVKGAETATSPAERTWFEADRRLREGRTLRDIGIWSRYVGDASQPLLVTVHHDGWGNYPNPNGYRMANIHARVGSSFVRQNLERSTVAAEVEPFKDCKCSIEEQTRALLFASLAQVGPLYALEKQGGFEWSDPRGIAFATKQFAAGAQATRDMIVNAWLDSANTPVGYPMVNVRDIESGEVRATPELFKAD